MSLCDKRPLLPLQTWDRALGRDEKIMLRNMHTYPLPHAPTITTSHLTFHTPCGLHCTGFDLLLLWFLLLLFLLPLRHNIGM